MVEKLKEELSTKEALLMHGKRGMGDDFYRLRLLNLLNCSFLSRL